MPKRPRSGRLEAWPQTPNVPQGRIRASRPCFETCPAGAPQHEGGGRRGWVHTLARSRITTFHWVPARGISWPELTRLLTLESGALNTDINGRPSVGAPRPVGE